MVVSFKLFGVRLLVPSSTLQRRRLRIPTNRLTGNLSVFQRQLGQYLAVLRR